MNNNFFLHCLNIKLIESLPNNFGKDNFDEFRFGAFPSKSIKEKVKDLLRKKFTPNYEILQCKDDYESLISKYGEDLSLIFTNLDEKTQKLFVDIIAYRILGYTKVKLPLNSKFYWESLEKAESLKVGNETINPNFMHFMLERFNLSKIGYDIELFFSVLGIAIDFIIEQYACKISEDHIIQADNADIILDIGGCWGDTALYFAHKAGDSGKVFSFEFIPNNISIFKMNLEINPKLQERITIVKNPVSDSSNQIVYYKDNGPGSSVSTEMFEGYSGKTETLSIDDFVQQQNLPRVDFIKMDIEGAEPLALQGALNTIKNFRPKMAIAIYHSLDDFVNIPNWIADLNLDYELFIGHYTIHSEETVCFAKPRNR